MIVSELIEQLKALRPDLQVLISIDMEGNGFSDAGEITIHEMTPDCEIVGVDVHDTDDDGEPWPDLVQVAVIYPQ